MGRPRPGAAGQAGQLAARLASGPRAAALALAALAVVLFAAFDGLGPPLAYNDDWGMAWAVDHFPRIYPASSALALPQDLWAYLVTVGHHDRRLLRLTTIIFVAAALFAVERLSRRAGADATWSAMAALSLAAFPVFSADATTFMTDVPYVALELAAALAAIRLLDGRSGAPLVLLTVLAALQRQVGILLPVGVAVALLLTDRGSRRTWAWTVGAGVAAAAAVAAVGWLGLAPPTQANRLGAIRAQNLVFVLADAMFLPGVVGLGAAVLAPGLLMRRAGRSLGPLAVGLVVWELFVFAVAARDVFPGNVLTPQGINRTPIAGHKPQLYATPDFLALEALAVVTAAAFVLRLRAALPKRAPVPALLVALAVTQFLPLLLVDYVAFDRYYLPIVAVLLPLAARAASGASNRAAYAGVGIAAVLVAVYAVGEQDYMAWQSARDRAAHIAYAQASPYEVDAGYEANAVYGEVPAYDRDGTLLSGLARPGARDFSTAGPESPALRLLLVPASDPRPGVVYASLAPGKVVVVPGTTRG